MNPTSKAFPKSCKFSYYKFFYAVKLFPSTLLCSSLDSSCKFSNTVFGLKEKRWNKKKKEKRDRDDDNNNDK